MKDNIKQLQALSWNKNSLNTYEADIFKIFLPKNASLNGLFQECSDCLTL